MMQRADPNLEILARAVARLGYLADRMVFLGGCATALLLTDPAAPEVRSTQDVDVITEVGSLTDYYRLADELRGAGFAEDRTPGAPLCRWCAPGVVLDVMPTDERVLGFGNRWFRPALASAQRAILPSGAIIRAVTAPYFLATKLEAFDGRGRGDYLASQDIEDIVTLLDGRAEVVEDVSQADDALRRYLAGRFLALLSVRPFVQALAGHLPHDAASQARLPVILERIRAIARVHP
jgi:hypothetical protein